MRKKLTRHGNSLALVFDKPLLKLLNVEEGDQLELEVQGETLIVRAAKKKKAQKKSETEKIRAIGKKIMKQYEQTFKKLAKT